MIQQSNHIDVLLRAKEEGSVSDLSRIDLHWGEMKDLLAFPAHTTGLKVPVNPSAFILFSAIMALSFVFIETTRNPATGTSQPLLPSKEHSLDITTPLVPAEVTADTTPPPVKTTPAATSAHREEHLRIGTDSLILLQKVKESGSGRVADHPYFTTTDKKVFPDSIRIIRIIGSGIPANGSGKILPIMVARDSIPTKPVDIIIRNTSISTKQSIIRQDSIVTIKQNYRTRKPVKVSKTAPARINQ